MFCPNDECPDLLNTGIRAEYREDLSACPFCGAALVHWVEEKPPQPEEEMPAPPRVADDEVLEPVFESSDLPEVMVIKTLLDDAGIPYLTRNEDLYDALRGAFRGGFLNPTGRPVVFLVPARLAEQARQLLEEFASSGEYTGD